MIKIRTMKYEEVCTYVYVQNLEYKDIDIKSTDYASRNRNRTSLNLRPKAYCENSRKRKCIKLIRWVIVILLTRIKNGPSKMSRLKKSCRSRQAGQAEHCHNPRSRQCDLAITLWTRGRATILWSRARVGPRPHGSSKKLRTYSAKVTHSRVRSDTC